MIRLAEVLKEIVSGNALLQTGLRHRLLNLTQLGKFLKPQVEARAKKSASDTAILMALSRLQQGLGPKKGGIQHSEIEVDNISINANLCALTYPNSVPVTRCLTTLYNRVQKQAGFITITHGIREIRLIIERRHLTLVKEHVTEKALSTHGQLASLGVSFKNNYLEQPGFFYFMFQQLYFQNINIIEIASTASELLIYVNEKDVRIAFDTLYNRFLLQHRSA